MADAAGGVKLQAGPAEIGLTAASPQSLSPPSPNDARPAEPSE